MFLWQGVGHPGGDGYYAETARVMVAPGSPFAQRWRISTIRQTAKAFKGFATTGARVMEIVSLLARRHERLRLDSSPLEFGRHLVETPALRRNW